MSVTQQPSASQRVWIRSLTRLMGVMFAIEGIAGLIGNGLDLLERFRISNAYQSFFDGGTALAWTVASAFLLAAGLVLIFRSGFVVDAIFHESLDAEPTASDPPTRD